MTPSSLARAASIGAPWIIISSAARALDQARQPLGAAGARHDAQGDLRHAHPGVGHRGAVVAGERGLEAAAQRRAMQHGDHRLLRGLEAVEGVVVVGLGNGPAQLVEVRARQERPAGAGEQDDLGVGVGLSLVEGLPEALADGDVDGVHRRPVDGDDPHIALALVAHRPSHLVAPVAYCK
ncbi:hypothetical protein LRS04_16935 [Phenylobacterium sp. J367]|nr:hypothetical protein [Phenylobacterium sp. J367]MCR5879821.1 hypothetical protein [Phenylobacterium sp. J367]